MKHVVLSFSLFVLLLYCHVYALWFILYSCPQAHWRALYIYQINKQQINFLVYLHGGRNNFFKDEENKLENWRRRKKEWSFRGAFWKMNVIFINLSIYIWTQSETASSKDLRPYVGLEFLREVVSLYVIYARGFTRLISSPLCRNCKRVIVSLVTNIWS